MKATVIIEKAKDGYFSCYMENNNFDFGLTGHGETAAEAKADLMAAYSEFAEMQKEEGREIPALNFEFKYDLHSFFDYFNVLNVTKLAEKTGINPSLLRQYRSGAAKAGQKQYDKLESVIHEIGRELIAAGF
jgi:predicted RNase H-like HicB family nuclease